MTDLDYQRLLDAVEEAINQKSHELVWVDPSEVPMAANDNDIEWSLPPFPDGWHASP